MSDSNPIELKSMDEIVINGRRYLAADAFGTIAVDTVDSHACSDPHVEANVSALRERSVAGLKKYGVDLMREDLTVRDWFQHLIEELLDAANYARVLSVKHAAADYDAAVDCSRERLANFVGSVDQYIALKPDGNGQLKIAEPERKLVGWRWRHKNTIGESWHIEWANGRDKFPYIERNIYHEELYA